MGYVFFLTFNFGDNHVFDFYHTFVGKQEIKGKHQINVQNVVDFMKKIYIAVHRSSFEAIETTQLPERSPQNSLITCLKWTENQGSGRSKV